MAALPYMQLYVADYLADTAHLTAAQHGAYLLLIFNYWQRGKPLNNSNERLTNVARMTSDEWENAKPVLGEFFKIVGDEWFHERIERDLLAVNSKSWKASEAGKASAARRAEKKVTNVERTLNHTDTDTDTEEGQHTFVISDADDASEKKVESIDSCPQKEIIALYAEALPELPQPRVWEGQREKNLKARWRWVLSDLKSKGKPHDRAAGLDFFRRMFGYIHESDFLMGRVGTWTADLGWIVKAEPFAKIIQGNFENKDRAA